MNSTCKTVYCSQTGSSHLRSGRGCEDAANACSAEKTVSVCICDGAGSAKFPKEGAELCSQMAAKLAAEHFEALYHTPDQERGKRILAEILPLMQLEAEKLGTELKELSCTMLLAAYAPDSRAFTVHIGDGLMFSFERNGSIALVSRYQHEYQNLTSFVTSANPHCSSMTFQSAAGFLAMTDGIPEACMLSGGNPRRTAATMMLLSFLLPEAQLLHEYGSLCEMIQKRGSHDDMTIASLTDRSQISPSLLKSLPEKIFVRMFGLPLQQSKKVREKEYDLISEMYHSAEGISAAKAARILHIHSASRARRHLERMRKRGMLHYEKGKYFIPG